MPQNFCTEDYGTWRRIGEVQAIAEAMFSSRPAMSRGKLHTLSVIGSRPLRPPYPPKTISCSWGLSGDEIRLASEAGHHMERWGYPLFYAVVSDQNRPEREIRGIVRELKSDIVQAQRETGTPPYWLEMSEGEPAFHSNILFPLGGQQPQRIINRISRSKPYPGSTLLLQSAQGSEWFVAYCSKERAPQAKWVGGIKMHKRLPGSHTLGEGGGDRVKLSQALKKDLLAKGQKPWKRDYASRSLPPLAVKIHEPDPHGLFGLLHDQARPNLKPSYHRAKIADHPHQMQFPFIRLVPDVIDLLANLAPTHEQIAEKIGRSRSQVTNIINRQFRPSKAVVRHVLSLASAA